MNPTVYVETSVVSYLTTRRSRDVVVAAYQEVTRDWWRSAPGRFVLYASALVLSESRTGDSAAAQARLQILGTMPLLDATGPAVELQCGRRCGAHRHRGCERRGLLGYVELPAHRQCNDAIANRGCLSAIRLSTAGHLHPERTSGDTLCGRRKPTRSSMKSGQCVTSTLPDSIMM